MGSKAGRPRVRNDLRGALRALLSTGPKLSHEIAIVRKELNAASSVTYRALRALGAKSVPVGDVGEHLDQWQWYLPQHADMLMKPLVKQEILERMDGSSRVPLVSRAAAEVRNDPVAVVRGDESFPMPTLPTFLDKALPVEADLYDAVQRVLESLVPSGDLRPWGLYRRDQLLYELDKRLLRAQELVYEGLKSIEEIRDDVQSV